MRRTIGCGPTIRGCRGEGHCVVRVACCVWEEPEADYGFRWSHPLGGKLRNSSECHHNSLDFRAGAVYHRWRCIAADTGWRQG